VNAAVANAATSQEGFDVGKVLPSSALVVNIFCDSPAHLAVGMLVQVEPSDNLVVFIPLPLGRAYRS
jgi:hypothetical protein